MKEEAAKFVEACKGAVRSLGLLETMCIGMREKLDPQDWKEALDDVLLWLQTTDELPKKSLLREISRELIAQTCALGMYKDYQGVPEAYIA